MSLFDEITEPIRERIVENQKKIKTLEKKYSEAQRLLRKLYKEDPGFRKYLRDLLLTKEAYVYHYAGGFWDSEKGLELYRDGWHPDDPGLWIANDRKGPKLCSRGHWVCSEETVRIIKEMQNMEGIISMLIKKFGYRQP